MTDLKNFQNCRHHLGKIKIAVESENNMTYRLVNQSQFDIEKWSTDGCVFKNNTACDFLFLVTDGKSIKQACWIEMKGSDVNKAAFQILETIKKTNLDSGYTHHARIIASRNPAPKYRDSNYRNMENFIRANGGTVKNENRLLEETI